MLEQKLAEASEDARAKRSRLIFILVGITFAVGLFLVGIVKLDLSVIGIGAGPQATPSSSANIEAEKASPASVAAPESELSLEAKSKARDAFKALLSKFDNDLAPEVETDAFAAWNAAARDEILAGREAAVTAFTAGDYSSAILKIEDATARAGEEISARDAAFQRAIENADNAYKADDFETASVGINEALRLQPNANDALSLKEKIDQLPKVLGLIEKAVTARVENNLELEARLLRQVIALAPDRLDIKQRLVSVETQIREAHYATFISNGMKAVEQRALGQATNYLNKARSLFSGREGVVLLSAQVENLKRELDAEKFITDGIQASAADNWETAAQLFTRAGKVLPNNKDASDGLQLASTIIDLKKKTAQHLAAPARLSSQNVAKSAQETIKKAKSFNGFSPSLKAENDKLAVLLASYSTPVMVTVLSDGLTHVSVRSVGQVGKTTGKSIQLKPGKYAFEGKRKGYKSKLIQVEIPPGTTPVTVEVVCDEPI